MLNSQLHVVKEPSTTACASAGVEGEDGCAEADILHSASVCGHPGAILFDDGVQEAHHLWVIPSQSNPITEHSLLATTDSYWYTIGYSFYNMEEFNLAPGGMLAL